MIEDQYLEDSQIECSHCVDERTCSCNTCLSKAGASSSKVLMAVVECSYCKSKPKDIARKLKAGGIGPTDELDA